MSLSEWVQFSELYSSNSTSTIQLQISMNNAKKYVNMKSPEKFLAMAQCLKLNESLI